MRKRILKGVLALLGLSVATVPAWSDEQEIPLDKLPAAVVKSVKEKFPNGEIKKAEKEVEHGKTVFEVALKHEGHDVEVGLKEDGTILEIEKRIKEGDLPKDVSAALKAKYPKATFKKIEEITKGEKTLYEVVVVNNKKTREVVLDRSGKIVEDGEDDED